ncbi:unnamed protein product [Cuscuta europaea]|uniref:Exocyst subunit Exo70 family protein n=1 Tax=Cuscuta europaea TaxID=41803 RepID=A0A9P1EL32_CUSEU|nr:unnamed protein product [Cuscuta europaea]
MTLPTTPRRMKAAIFASSKTNSSHPSSSSSTHSSPSQTPSHTLSESMMEETIDNAEVIIKKWDPKGSYSHEKLFQENKNEAREFIKCIKELRRVMHLLVSNRSDSGKLARAQNSMHLAMERLQKEFFQILLANRERLHPESVSTISSCISTSLSSDSEKEDSFCLSDNDIHVAMSDLRQIGHCMVSSGYAKECVNIFELRRKSVVEEGLYNLGIRRYSSSSRHISKTGWNIVEDQIKNWLSAVRFAVRSLFNGERLLCDYVFSASETIREACFTHIAKDDAINLFRFPELVVAGKSKISPDQVFVLMDIYEEISELFPEIESIFSYESVSEVRQQALSSLQKVGLLVQTLISDFEKSVQKDSSKKPIHGGGIHPLTRSVMDFVSSMGDYSGTFQDIIGEVSVSTRIDRIILTLLCKLDTKSRLYNDVALSYLFLANNFRFVTERIRSSSLLECLLGDESLSNLDRKVNSYIANYKAMAWGKVISSLPDSSDPSLSIEEIDAHFREFSVAFEEAYRKQRAYAVPDGKLRDEIKLAVAREFVAYKEFYDAYLDLLSSEKNMEALVRYSPDNLGNYLSDLFHGTSMSGISPPSSSRSRASRFLP